MLFLAKYLRRPSYSDGAIYLGLIEAESKEEAEIIVAKMFVEVEKIYESDYGEEDEEEFTTPKEISVSSINEMLHVQTIPTTYRDY
jgi:hypothetical protein